MDQFEDKRIDEALELLNAAARDKKTELQTAMANKYTDLSSVMSAFTSQIRDQATEKFVAGKQRIVDAATGINRSVHCSPWVYIGGSAAAAMLFGFMMGRSRRD